MMDGSMSNLFITETATSSGSLELCKKLIGTLNYANGSINYFSIVYQLLNYCVWKANYGGTTTNSVHDGHTHLTSQDNQDSSHIKITFSTWIVMSSHPNFIFQCLIIIDIFLKCCHIPSTIMKGLHASPYYFMVACSSICPLEEILIGCPLQVYEKAP